MRAKPKRRNTDDEHSSDKDAFHVSCIGPDEGPKVFNIFIFAPILSAEQFIPAIEAMQVAGEDDAVVVHLSTPGGDIDATDTFLHACDQCAAQIVFIASGGVHSAGTLMLMFADKVFFSNGFNALIHNGSIGYGAKFSDWKIEAAYTLRHMEALMRRAYDGFLTTEETDQMLDGKDFWFNAEEFSERLQKRNDKLAA
jgi:ATP-dependent protease ClpP protease subunit